MTESLSDSLIAIVIDGAAHHLDLRLVQAGVWRVVLGRPPSQDYHLVDSNTNACRLCMHMYSHIPRPHPPKQKHCGLGMRLDYYIAIQGHS